MRYMAVLGLILIMARTVRGEAETFFRTEERRTGAYLAPVFRINSANEQFGIWLGGRLGFVTNSVLSYGLEAYGLATEVKADYPEGERFHAGVAGIYLEALVHPERRVHTAWSILLGAGSAVAEDIGDISQDDAVDNSFLVVEPEFTLEYNLSRNVRFAPGISYRWISGSVSPLDSKWQLSETSINFRLKFGDFEGKPVDEW